MSKLGYYQPWYLLGGILTLTGSALLYTVIVDTIPAAVYGYIFILGAGVGCYV